MPLLLERFSPLFWGVITAIYSYFWIPEELHPKIIKDFLNPVINVSAITVGFLTTVMTVLITIDTKEVIQWLKSANYYQRLISYLMSAVKSAFLVAITSALGSILDTNSLPSWEKIGFSLWLGLLIYTVMASYRVINIIVTILRSDR
jgi:hypothetical protein